jgi:hypothetical protein
LPHFLISQAQGVTSAASFLPLDKRRRLHVGVRHGLKGEQTQGMLSGKVLFGLLLVAALAGFNRWQQNLRYIGFILVKRTVTIAAVKEFRHDTLIEILYLFGRNLGMTLLTGGILPKGCIVSAKKKKNRC